MRTFAIIPLILLGACFGNGNSQSQIATAKSEPAPETTPSLPPGIQILPSNLTIKDGSTVIAYVLSENHIVDAQTGYIMLINWWTGEILNNNLGLMFTSSDCSGEAYSSLSVMPNQIIRINDSYYLATTEVVSNMTLHSRFTTSGNSTICQTWDTTTNVVRMQKFGTPPRNFQNYAPIKF